MAREQGKRPSYQWYPGDFRRDTAVYSLPFPVRSFWREMLDIMHDGEPYGHLTAGGDPIPPADLARMIGVRPSEAVKWLDILERRHVYSRTPEGVIYCRRMVRDDKTLTARINGGKDAPQPNAKGGGKGKPKGGGKGADSPPSDPPPAVCSLQSASALEPPAEANASDTGPIFLDFWDAWPAGHRVNRKQAEVQWARLTPYDRGRALEAVQWRVAHDQAWEAPRDDGRWAIPHPFRYLRDRRFTDVQALAAPRPTPASKLAPWRPRRSDPCDHDPLCENTRACYLRREREAADVAEQPA